MRPLISGPNLPNYVISCANTWKQMKPNEKIMWETMASEDRIRYEKECKVFEAGVQADNVPVPVPVPGTKSAWYIYCEENREATKAKNPKMKGNQITLLLAEQWNFLKKSHE
jgi:hypothetical protein